MTNTQREVPFRDHWRWSKECTWIDGAMEHRGKVKEMNFSTEVFKRYVRMQIALAKRDGQFDAATHIQHVLNDLEAR